MKIISWNVNGIRAVAKKGFWDWFQKEKADVACLQETKAFHHQLEPALQCPPGYEAVWHEGTRPGYAGTATFAKEKPVDTMTAFEGKYACFHEHGRVVETQFQAFRLLNIYFPNGQTNAAGEEKLTYKLEFYDHLLEYLEPFRKAGEKIILCGDFNICHREIDIARPKANANSIGFTPVERAKIDEVCGKGYVDVFRHLHPQTKDAYTWWSYRAGARPRNVGWRIDYFFVTPNVLPHIKSIKHQTDVMGSDHCPVELQLDI